ncbi:MAP kinase kinase kinase SSK2 [Spathaspora sp. JA1]|nr:MAP kinase kinase kinase SSK2 [Spathaspora sp. JA1]
MGESDSKSPPSDTSQSIPLTPPKSNSHTMHNDSTDSTKLTSQSIRQHNNQTMSTSGSTTSIKSPLSQHSPINTSHSALHRQPPNTSNGVGLGLNISNNNQKFTSIKSSSPGATNSAPTSAKSPANTSPSTNNTAASATSSRRSRSRSLSSQQSPSQQLGHVQYLAQEKAYLRKMRNQLVDDYYTKGITGADDFITRNSVLNENDEADDDDDDNGDDEYDYDFDDSTTSSQEGGPGDNNTHLLVDIDNDKYPIDFGLALSLIPDKGNNKQPPSLTREDTDDPAVIERLEWQSMLTAVLTGDVVRSEKTKIINNNNPDNSNESSYLHATYKENLWFGINAKLFNRTEDDQRRIVSYRRTLVDQLIQDILNFEVNYDNHEVSIRNQIETIVEKYHDACSLWRTLEEMKNDEPICRSLEFQNRIDALIAWLNITDAITRETKSLRLWIGNDELDISKSPIEVPVSSDSNTTKIVKRIFDEDNKSLAERLMKEKDIQTIFRKRIFKPISPWMIKSKDTYIRLGDMFETMKLPDYIHDLLQICVIPMKLIKEIINVRLGYAMKLTNPTLMMIDQMIDDLKSYITVALEVKSGIQEYIKTDGSSTNWVLSDLFDTEINDFDVVVLRCVRYFLVLLNRKLLDSSRSPTNFRTFKEPDELEQAWNFLSSLGTYIDGGSVVVAEQITLLTSRLCHRLLAYFTNQIRSPPDLNQDLIRWYNSTTDNFGQLRRKLARFTGEISRDFSNSLVFDIPNLPHANVKFLLEILKSTNHFLVYTSTVESKGTYFFASGDLITREPDILKIINGSYIGLNPNEKKKNFADILNLMNKTNSENSQDPQDLMFDHPRFDYSYVIALCPLKPIVWEGPVVNVHMDSLVPITDVRPGQMLLITKLPYYELPVIRDQFLDLISDIFIGGGSMKPIEQRCSLARVHHELTKINRAFFKMCLAVLDSVKIVRDKVKGFGEEYQTLVNNFFIYSRDYGKNAVRNLDSGRKATVIMKLIQLSIDWVSFVCDDCIPTDRKTFRWCVLALEFAMDMTKGFNVLVLNEDQFDKLKIKVARCMSLLISHFDIMGARSSEAEKNKLLKWTISRQQHGIENSQDEDGEITKIYHQELMQQITEIEEYRRELQEQLQSVGRVLDVSDSEYQYVTLLASSFSSLSIRWQKGRFIGGGTFGQVFSAVNLDTGGIMAVKEIRFHDSQSIKNIVPSIKEEMTVLEMLNHPNVVQYFGVEVHRDKVYIFMEYCEGGSLSGLLTHGRIEDEMVVQVYTLQMLEGLAYLHQSGVIHRDIKPENILLDHNGVIKFVDFGAAKVIANTGRTRVVGTASIRSAENNPVNNPNNLNSMTGTPMYMSPEVITGATSSDRSGVVDIWSLGCCVLEMTTGRRPWSNLDNEWAIMYHIAAGHKPPLPSPDQMSEAGRKFLSRCLEHDPIKRPSAVELLADPWMVSIRQVAFGAGGDSNNTPTSEAGGSIE